MSHCSESMFANTQLRFRSKAKRCLETDDLWVLGMCINITDELSRSVVE